jgi:hypothetical protein
VVPSYCHRMTFPGAPTVRVRFLMAHVSARRCRIVVDLGEIRHPVAVVSQ